jgi:hypothetical protein
VLRDKNFYFVSNGKMEKCLQLHAELLQGKLDAIRRVQIDTVDQLTELLTKTPQLRDSISYTRNNTLIFTNIFYFEKNDHWTSKCK